MDDLIQQIAQQIVDQVAPILAEQLKSAAPVPAEPLKLLWNEPETASAVGVSASFLKQARLAGHFNCHTSKRPVLYAREHLEEIKVWLASRRMDPTRTGDDAE